MTHDEIGWSGPMRRACEEAKSPPRYRVEFYTSGPLWCVADYVDEATTGMSPVVRYHESVGWRTIFNIKDEAEALASRMNAEASQ